MTLIRPFIPGDETPLTAIWLRSVRATHRFLSEEDIAFYLPLVRDAFALMETWILEENGSLLGFMAMDGNKVEALFLEPEQRGQGGGRRLMEFARSRLGPGRPLLVDVNEGNPEALGFYLRLGFRQTGRSPVDGSGRPHPLLHLELAGPITPSLSPPAIGK